MIRRFKQRGTEKLAKRAASREKRLAAMDVIDRPEGTTGKMKLSFKADFQSGRDVLYAEGLSKSFGYGSRRTELFHGCLLYTSLCSLQMKLQSEKKTWQIKSKQH